ncbi:MAG: aldo/keto reductase [Spirochaetaceae bacterium]|nr:aldo/keto reductase [Spirochaetaceae bacterium]
MEQRSFGDSGLTCSALGFGTWELSTTDYGEIDAAEAQRAAQEAIDHGITLFDTAESYGPRISEELLGKALGARRKEIGFPVAPAASARPSGQLPLEQRPKFVRYLDSPELTPVTNAVEGA